MTALNNRGIPLSSINPRYLHSNSTSHTWPFSAVAELIDNAYDPDVSAKQFWINKTVTKKQDCLIFMDNGKGMDYDKMHKMLSFGFCEKQTVRGHVPVGYYGNGFKSGSMRLGKDAIVFSKKADTMCVGLLSQTYLETTGAQNIIVPIVTFTKTGQTVSAAPEHAECLHDILTYSLFNTKEELLSEFSVIDGLCTKSSGTRIIIWNLRKTSSGDLEIDLMTDCYDIQIPNEESTKETNKRQTKARMSVPESEYSLRAYCSILYLKPKMQIILQGKKVEAQFVTKTLANIMKDTYKPVCIPPLKKEITITFGYNTKTKEHYGLMMYHKNRLIKAYERVACQRRANIIGVGVIGVMECNYLTPTHNKQDFDNTDEYRKTMLSVGYKLEEYWKEVRYELKKTLNCTEPAEDIVKQPDQTWVQCDDCLKWRKLPDGVNSKNLPKKWFCHINPDPLFRSCAVEEEPEDSDEEQSKYNKKNYKQDEKNQKMQEEKNKEQQSHFSPESPSSAHKSSAHAGAGSTASGDTSVGTQDTHISSTPARKKRALDPNQENLNKKKARGKSIGDIQDSLKTSTASSMAVCLPAMPFPDTIAHQAEWKDINNVDKSAVKMRESNEIIDTISEIQENYESQYLQAMETIKQLQHKLECVETEKCMLLKDLEKIKRVSEKVKADDQGVQTDFSIFSNKKVNAATATEASNSERECSLKLRELRKTVARLLVISHPVLDLQQVNYDCEVVDEILTQIVEEKEEAFTCDQDSSTYYSNL